MTMPSIVLFLVSMSLTAEATPAQNRTFSQQPETLLGLKCDRPASRNLMDVDSDGFPDIGTANPDGLNGIHINRPARKRQPLACSGVHRMVGDHIINTM
jgi:hypothetical protein